MILLPKHLWSLIIYTFVVSTYHRVCRRVSANCWAGLCVLERRQPGWSGEVVLRVPGYGGPDWTTAQEETPANDTALYSFRETKGETAYLHKNNPVVKVVTRTITLSGKIMCCFKWTVLISNIIFKQMHNMGGNSVRPSSFLGIRALKFPSVRFHIYTYRAMCVCPCSWRYSLL